MVGLSTIAKHRGGRAIGPEARQALGTELRRLRTSRGLTQAQLASPLTRAYVCAVERGRITPSLGSLLLFARRLEVPVSDLIATLDGTAGCVK